MINIDQAVTESPVWHDGSSGGDLLSGEILCTLKALTPLLPGNARYKVDEADQTKLRQWRFGNLDKEKQISEPLLLEDGRVVIAGSALKGMIRHSLSALLSAPMERVNEHGKKVVLQNCLTPKDCEKVPREKQNDRDVAPECLTGARLLFGYVRNDEDTPIGKGVFERMAGRIVPNHAVSVGVPRFMGKKEKSYCVPLKVLGQPKPTAKHYLNRNGRKYYRHQPSVKTDNDIAAQGEKAINSNQSTLARFICAPETQFKYTIRFARLQDWELGALLAVLQPHQLAKNGNPIDYAHKLGLGRPLGMGSVYIITDQIRLRQEKDTRFLENNDVEKHKTQALVALKDKLATNKIATQDWLTMHAYTDHGLLDYPRLKAKVPQ
ncbi:RAMP superfamily CRISPR-associated protein [Nitrosomonas cryotolerans]|nr:RAMP superfamily CRISPR-associated protein [Nitrosomonas cryotolerans]